MFNASPWPGVIWEKVLNDSSKEACAQSNFDQVNKDCIQLQRNCNSAELLLREGATTLLPSNASCPLIFRLTNLIFQLLFPRGELMSPNTCSKIPRHTPSLCMVPATATSTRPWGEARTLSAQGSRLGLRSRRSSFVRASRRRLTSSAPMNSSISSLPGLRKRHNTQSLTVG